MNNIGGSGCELLIPDRERQPLAEIERSIVKSYGRYLWSKFVRAIKDYKLVEDGDRIAIAISGGKDSLLMAKLFQQYKRSNEINFDVHFIAMDPGYHEKNRELLISNCEYLNIPIEIFKSDIFETVERISADYPCYMCARMRRGALYTRAGQLGCNKLALGHHFNDVIETTMMNMLYAGSFKTMRPKLKSDNFPGLTLIRPLYYIHEDDIKRFTVKSGISAMNCGCIVAAKKTSSKRREIKELIKSLKMNFDNVDQNIFQSAKNVNLDCILGWEQNREKHSYLEFYDE